MKREKVKVEQLAENPNNPRLLKADKKNKLEKSIKEFPEMLEARPIVVNTDYTILGGNMRYKALLATGAKEVDVLVVDWSEDKQKEFIIKDNVGFGEWDWEEVATWDEDELIDWAVDLPSDLFKGDVDYSILDDEDFSEELDNMEGDVRRALQIPFEAEDYDEAKELYQFWVEQGAYVGAMILEHLKEERKKTEL